MIWLGADASAYAVPCDACAEETARRFGPGPHLIGETLVEGTLRAEADVGFTACRRGHRIRVRRIARLRVVAAR